MNKTKRSPAGTIVFWVLYALLFVGFFFGMRYALGRFHAWLERYEASQPKYACQQVFDEIFAAKDWQRIASLSAESPSVNKYENKAAFARYLEEKYGDAKITYTETSAGLSGDKKYVVKADDEKFASFTLVSATNESGLDNWHLGTVETLFRQNEEVLVTALAGHRITLNGIPVDESKETVRKTYTAVESYLPEGLHGPSEYEIRVGGFLLEPEVKVLDEAGNECALAYDANEHHYTENAVSGSSYTEAEEKLAISAAKSYALYMIGAASTGDLRTYFDSESDIYNTIRKSETWMQSYSGYAFSTPELSQFYRYSEELFSIRVKISLNVTRKNGTVKEYPLNSTFFFQKKGSSFLVTEMTNVDVMQKTEEVRLDFYDGDTLLQSSFVTVGCSEFGAPTLTQKDGKSFSGWAEESVDEKGNVTLTLRFVPENGVVSVSPDYKPEPMRLYAVYESEGA